MTDSTAWRRLFAAALMVFLAAASAARRGMWRRPRMPRRLGRQARPAALHAGRPRRRRRPAGPFHCRRVRPRRRGRVCPRRSLPHHRRPAGGSFRAAGNRRNRRAGAGFGLPLRIHLQGQIAHRHRRHRPGGDRQAVRRPAGRTASRRGSSSTPSRRPAPTSWPPAAPTATATRRSRQSQHDRELAPREARATGR